MIQGDANNDIGWDNMYIYEEEFQNDPWLQRNPDIRMPNDQQYQEKQQETEIDLNLLDKDKQIEVNTEEVKPNKYCYLWQEQLDYKTFDQESISWY